MTYKYKVAVTSGVKVGDTVPDSVPAHTIGTWLKAGLIEIKPAKKVKVED